MLGLGASGMSMVRWLVNRGADVRVADTRPAPPFMGQLRKELPEVELRLGSFDERAFAGVEVVAISPGIPLGEPLVRRARDQGVPIVGDIELFAQIRREYLHCKVIAITGSNGKSTVTEMVGAMCRAAGIRTALAGNIGTPVLNVVSDIDAGKRRAPDVFVLELSSFQLESTSSLNPEAAVVLNLSEDHMDRYENVPQYAQAKARIFNGDGVQVLNRDDHLSRDMSIDGRCVFSFGSSNPVSNYEWGLRELDGETWLAQGSENLIKASELGVTGTHNLCNALAALALCRSIRLPYPKLLDGLRNFSGLPHRVQKIAEISGISFYDDSKGTNVGATVAALNGMNERSVIILGGEGKGQDFSPLAPAVATKARAVVLIGRDRKLIHQALEKANIQIEHADDMGDAVRRAYRLAHSGDAVLLSPACASFDMYRDYVQRAEMFADEVTRLRGEG